ncbi:MAG: biopolymer transporter ExbD [Bacteroides sp.]|nr:biopolymer transporter ExbD [Bacteroides sp.]MBD5418635.1 biopolymer transporter ExbD [Bacteroides sp.]MDE7462957.1 biopolymer transporter ExbD [Muribaculaceae bacterium]
MALKRQFPTLDTFSMSSMTDVIFLLLIFFMVTSTLIHPAAIDVNLPQSGEQSNSKPTTEVYVDSVCSIYLVEDRNDSTGVLSIPHQISKEQLTERLTAIQAQDSLRPVALYADERVPYGKVVDILDMAARSKLRMVLATKSRSVPAE